MSEAFRNWYEQVGHPPNDQTSIKVVAQIAYEEGERAATPQWQNIESAPKDRAIKLWYPKLTAWAPGDWTGGWSYVWNQWSIHLPFKTDGRCAILTPKSNPTHWQPLPEKPID